MCYSLHKRSATLPSLV